jgi:hypothetical protein
VADKDTHQQQKATNAPEAGSQLLELAHLLARLTAREAFECAGASHGETSGRPRSESEDICEVEV